MRRVLSLLREIHLSKIADYFSIKYTPPASDHAHPDIDDDNVEDDVAQMLQYEFEELSGAADMTQQHLQIIGEVIGKLSPHFARLCLCLKPVHGFWPNGNMESAEEFKQRINIVCHSFRTIMAYNFWGFVC